MTATQKVGKDFKPNINLKTANQSINCSDLTAMHYFYTTGKNTWKEVSTEYLHNLLNTNPPEFTTILGFPKPYDEENESLTQYIGPLYFDLDGDITVTIPQYQKLLRKLVDEFDVNLNALSLYATGGRGFHLEIPQACFMTKPPTEGTLNLPQIYKVMALELYVDTVDLVIYSSRKGRMWRVPNRVRSNGNYKVPITPEQAFTMTPESYSQLCAQPRRRPQRDEPKFSVELGMLFGDAREEVIKKQNAQVKTSLVNSALKQRFGSDFPASLKPLLDGRIQSPKGFNLVALQLAATANALGLSEAHLISSATGLIQKHSSDGRYNTPRKREAELRNQFKYTSKGTYLASVGGIRSILPKGFPTPDLRGLEVRA